MASNQVAEYDFVEQPPEEFYCPIKFALLCEPYLTECCGSHVSSEAYLEIQGQPCPMCREEKYSAIKDKYFRRKVMSLKVRCPHKAEGCEWEGELGSLEQHLNTNSCEGECGYVDVDCPYACGERVQRRNVEEHKSQHCPLRPFTCQYCNLEATHQKITVEHWPVCEKYPLPCSNECGEEEMERQHLKGHLEQICPLEEIKCEFSYAGCGAQLQRRLMSAHIKKNSEAHLFLLAQEAPKLKDRVKQQEDQIKQLGDQIKQQGDQIKQQGDQIKQQGEQISALMKLLPVKVPPVDIIMDDFEEHKKNDNDWYSPPFYSHVGGYKMCLKVYANGVGDAKGTHVSVYVYLMRGEFDDDLKWPFSAHITIDLKKNIPPHHKYRFKFEGGKQCNKPKENYKCNTSGWGYRTYISHADIYSGRYLSNNRLTFCISKVEVGSV